MAVYFDEVLQTIWLWYSDRRLTPYNNLASGECILFHVLRFTEGNVLFG